MANNKQNDILDIAKNILNEIEENNVKVDGVIEVLNGEVNITNPQLGGKYPVIHGDNALIILVNGTQIYGPTVVSASDTVKILGNRKEPISSFKIEVSKDKMQALLTVTRSKGEIYKPEDLEPTTEAYIRSTLAEVIEPPNIKETEVNAKLKEEGIIFGIKSSAIKEAIMFGSNYPVVIAEGNPVINGVDGEITYMFSASSKIITTVGNAERVNHLNRIQIKSVTIGEVLAIKNPSSEGVSGKTITGEEVLPKVAKEIEIRINKGVELLENGNVAVANCSGRPVLEGRNKDILSVLPLYIVEGDVDVHTGNIKFKGDVLVKGSVQEGLNVTAGGTVEVLKNVNGKIEAKGSVLVHGNIIHGKIRAGGITALYHQVSPILLEIDNLLKKLIMTIQQVKNHPSFSTTDLNEQGDGKLIQLLIDTRYTQIRNLIIHFQELILSNDDIYYESLKLLLECFVNNLYGLAPMRIKTADELNVIRQKISEVINSLESSIGDDSNLIASYVQNSNIQVSGDINIEGKEIFNSFIVAGGDVIVNGAKGYIRGSNVIGQKNLYAKEIGSGFDTNTRVSVSSKGIIKADVVYNNVFIQVGSCQHRINQTIRAFEAYIDKEGRLLINSLKQ